MMNRESAHRTRKALLPPSDAIPAAALIDREEALTEQYHSVGEPSYRRRLDIESELSAIRRDLARLGFAPSDVRWRASGNPDLPSARAKR